MGVLSDKRCKTAWILCGGKQIARAQRFEWHV
jgi:hypothetical protein